MRTCRWFAATFLPAISLILAATGAVCAADQPPTKVRLRGVLVGVSHYDHLPHADLLGPANDVPQLAALFSDWFKPETVRLTLLTEQAGKANPLLRPTEANIERELAKLAADAQAGEQVVIYLSGHGVQQLAAADDDLELDGLDEVFLPADAERSRGGAVPHGLTDDELRAALHAIAAKQASVWLIADCCHSGTIARGLDVPRRLSPDALFSSEMAAEIVRRQEQPAAVSAPRGGLPEGAVALYACRSHEPAVERFFASATTPRMQSTYGLLSYSLMKVLRSQRGGEPLTYRDLLQRIQDEYVALGYVEYPVPLLEGTVRERLVLGNDLRQQPSWKLTRSEGQWLVRAGRLHGMTKGSILAVYPPGSASDGERLGHVEVQSSAASSSQVVPCAFSTGGKTWPVVVDFPADSRCELVYFHYGDLGLTIAADDPADGVSQPAKAELQALLKQLGAQREVPLIVIDDPRVADWRLLSDRSLVYLSPAQGDFLPAAGIAAQPRFGGLTKAALRQQLPDLLRRIARAEMLRKIAATNPFPSRSPQVDVALELIKYRDAQDPTGVPVEMVARRPQLHVGDIVAFRITNRSKRAAVYVTLLSIDAGYGIKSLYPDLDEGEVIDVIPQGGVFHTAKFRVAPESAGIESLVALALKASGPPVDFSSLVQPTLALAQRTAQTRGPANAGSNLTQLLQGALFAQPTTRGIDGVEMEHCATRILTWETAK